MILITSPSKPFEFTAKLQPRRKNMIKAYAKEIDDLYAAVETSAQTDLKPPAEWTAASTLEFVRSVVETTMRKSIPDDSDIFQSGCDRYFIVINPSYRCSYLDQLAGYLDPQHHPARRSQHGQQGSRETTT